MTGQWWRPVACIVGADITLLAAAPTLERYSLQAAADPSSSAMLIATLLAANLALLALTLAALRGSVTLLNALRMRLRAQPWKLHRR